MKQDASLISWGNDKGDLSTSHPADFLEVLPYIPFELSTLLLGKKTRPFLEELTGISASHLRRGKCSEPRKSTVSRAIESTTAWSHNRVIEHGWSEEQWNSLIEFAPSSIAGEPRPFADFIHGLQIPGAYELPHATAFANEIDLLVVRLLDTYKSGDLALFKQALLDSTWMKPDATLPEDNELIVALSSATDWGATLTVCQRFIFDMLLCYFAALDAEFGLNYFTQFESRPLFLLVMPKLNAKVDLGSHGSIPRRNIIYQPNRRLLELSHALMVWRKEQRWPCKPVGRKELGEALGLDGQHIGNYFDGTRNINSKSFESYWVKMCETVAVCEPFYAPMPLLLAAIFWQRTITRYPDQKIRSFILPDKEKYTRYWEWHHQRWGSQLNKGTVGWPTWLDY